jgi:hypothetical protein
MARKMFFVMFFLATIIVALGPAQTVSAQADGCWSQTKKVNVLVGTEENGMVCGSNGLWGTSQVQSSPAPQASPVPAPQEQQGTDVPPVVAGPGGPGQVQFMPANQALFCNALLDHIQGHGHLANDFQNSWAKVAEVLRAGATATNDVLKVGTFPNETLVSFPAGLKNKIILIIAGQEPSMYPASNADARVKGSPVTGKNRQPIRDLLGNCARQADARHEAAQQPAQAPAPQPAPAPAQFATAPAPASTGNLIPVLDGLGVTTLGYYPSGSTNPALRQVWKDNGESYYYSLIDQSWLANYGVVLAPLPLVPVVPALPVLPAAPVLVPAFP